MAATGAVVKVATLGIQSGLWCRACRLSTGVGWWHTLNGGTLRCSYQCPECGGRDVEPDPHADWL